MPDPTPPTPARYFLEDGLYSLHPLATPEDKRALVRIEFYVDTLDVFCVACKSHSVFRSTAQLPSVATGTIVTKSPPTVEHLLHERQAWLSTADDPGGSVSKQDILAYVTRPRSVHSVFLCSRDRSHEMRFITRVATDGYQKIGQFPSAADLHLGDLARYRKLLGSSYSELSKGVGLFAHGVGIGSFVYLRRIFERQVEDAHQNAMAEPGWDEGEYQRSRMDEKILLLKHQLPAVIVENRAVYGVLSKGIHELSEEECKEYFPAVRTAIELILDEELSRVERDAKVAANRSAIGQIAGKLKGS